jgi:hypothetical protein
MKKEIKLESVLNSISGAKMDGSGSWKNFSQPFGDKFNGILAGTLNDSEQNSPLREAYRKFNNQIVFDLGAGAYPSATYKSLNEFNIKNYIAVDPFLNKCDKNNILFELE